MDIFAELSFKEFEGKWVPQTLAGEGCSFLDCRILENCGTVILQIYAAFIPRLFDGKVGLINVTIETKDEFAKAARFFKDFKKILIDKIVKDLENANLDISIEDDYSDIHQKLK